MSDHQLEFVQLLTSHQGRLYAYVISMLGNPDQARDVMQETNAVLWQKSDDFQSGTNFAAWMMQTAYYQVMAHRQKMNRERLVFDDAMTAELAEVAAQRNDLMEQRHAKLQDCLAKLSDTHRDLIRARYQDGFELAVIAQTMNRKTNAIKQALFRARAALIDCVKLNSDDALTGGSS
ncbi:ECF RNA polymerase sigma factor SigW [Stieleria bergensis]|uniref:ECF RNA polymerase sigma factor SigW n=1 Tax=Stieleria bergensis TaxID=2528025 RepID=A0A517STB3_9BACT|nr:ECF RNA polymerase sigma factor SigW [Planctomycetes bacterium SV_7m_r]